MAEVTRPIRVCLMSFERMDLVDFAGPLETLSHACDSLGAQIFLVEVAGLADGVKIMQSLTIHRDISLEKAMASLTEYDVLIVPGATYETTNNLCASDTPIKDVISQFAELPAAHTGRPRILLSICSGSFFLGSVSVLKGRRATTHYTIIPQLEQLCEQHGETEVVRKRFLYAGFLENGVRVVTSGGITSGFDATLYIVELLCGKSCADEASDTLDYQWRRAGGLF